MKKVKSYADRINMSKEDIQKGLNNERIKNGELQFQNDIFQAEKNVNRAEQDLDTARSQANLIPDDILNKVYTLDQCYKDLDTLQEEYGILFPVKK